MWSYLCDFLYFLFCDEFDSVSLLDCMSFP